MAFTLTELMALFPNQLWLEVSEQTQEEIWQVAQQRYSNPVDRWIVYLNALCLDRFLAWLHDEFDQRSVQLDSAPELLDQGVTGTRLKIGNTQIVLIPDDKSQVSEFYIPQAWVDLPAWVADYYLAVQLNLEAGWLRVWGYATSRQIREQASYEAISRTYCLAAEDLITNLNVLWAAQTQTTPIDVPPELAVGHETI